MAHLSPIHLFPAMYVPNHADDLPEHVDPIPMPDTREEAAVLCWLLDLGLYPTCEVLLERDDRDD